MLSALVSKVGANIGDQLLLVGGLVLLLGSIWLISQWKAKRAEKSMEKE